MRISLIRAWPGRFEQVDLTLSEGARVGDALAAAGIAETGGSEVACAIFGVLATPAAPLVDGDRVELLRPLLVDPKEKRRRRAGTAPRQERE